MASRTLKANWSAMFSPRRQIVNYHESEASTVDFGEPGWYQVAQSIQVYRTNQLQYSITDLDVGTTTQIIEISENVGKIKLPCEGWIVLEEGGVSNVEPIETDGAILSGVPSKVFGSTTQSEEIEEEYFDEDEFSNSVEDRDLMKQWISNDCVADDVYVHFQLRGDTHYQRIQLLYAAAVNAFVMRVFNDDVSLIKVEHVDGLLQKFIDATTYVYQFTATQQILETIKEEYVLYKNSEEKLPWEAAPVARAAQEFQRKTERHLLRGPDAINVGGLQDEYSGVYNHKGYVGGKPVYIKGDYDCCVRWFEEAWYIDDDIRNEDIGVAKLEVNCPHLGKRVQAKWLLYDAGLSTWRPSSRVSVTPIVFSDNAI